MNLRWHHCDDQDIRSLKDFGCLSCPMSLDDSWGGVSTTRQRVAKSNITRWRVVLVLQQTRRDAFHNAVPAGSTVGPTETLVQEGQNVVGSPSLHSQTRFGDSAHHAER